MRVRAAVSVAMAAIATAGVVAGCSSSSKASSPQTTGPSAGSRTTALSGTPITVEIITQLSGGGGAQNCSRSSWMVRTRPRRLSTLRVESKGTHLR